MATDIGATGLQSLSPVILDFFGTGMMEEHLKHKGTLHSSSDLLKICGKMGASWSAQDFRQTGVTPSGPGTFLLFFILKTLRTSSSLICSAGVGEVGVAEGVNGVFFKPAIRVDTRPLKSSCI